MDRPITEVTSRSALHMGNSGDLWCLTILMRKLRNSTQLISRIDTSAFASILVVLLWLLMFPASMFVDLPTTGVDLPKVQHPIPMPHARREDAILVAVSRSGDIFLDNDRIPYGGLPSRIRSKLKNGSEAVIYIRADARAKYRSVEDVLDQVQSSGVQHVVFLADQRRPHPSQ